MKCRLNKILEDRGSTVTWLSNKTGISRNAIHSYIRKENPTIPALDKAMEVAEALNLTVYDIWQKEKSAD